MTDQTTQTVINPFKEMNRYDNREADWPSDTVYEPPRRTLANDWKKFHADRDCGKATVRFVEQTEHRPVGESYEYHLYCGACGYEIPETEVLFIGGEWYHEHGWETYGKTVEDVWLPTHRVLELGPDPEQDELKDALRITRIEGQLAGDLTTFTVSGGERQSECEGCGQETPLRFNRQCRMCYGGEVTEEMVETLDGFERIVREQVNQSFGHRVEQKITPSGSRGELLWCRGSENPIPKIVQVTKQLEDTLTGEVEYVVQDPTLSHEWRYSEAELQETFWRMGIRSDETRPVDDDRVREVLEQLTSSPR